MTNKNKLYLKISIAIFLAIITVKLFSSNVFLANSPRFNPDFIASLRNIPGNLLQSSTNFFAANNGSKKLSQEQIKNYENLPATAMNQLAKGVYAKEDETGSVAYVRLTNDIEWEERVFNENGVQKIIRFPKGTIK